MEEKEAPAATAKTKPFPVEEMITKALSLSTGVGTSDFVRKALAASGYDVEKKRLVINNALKRLVKRGVVIQTKGFGATGSFKLNKQFEAQKKADAMAKKAAARAKKIAIAKRKEANARRKEANPRRRAANPRRRAARKRKLVTPAPQRAPAKRKRKAPRIRN